MDKNFIRIDDLVRQHLEGAEEKERGGAWLKMRDLLDQEMPQEKKRIGIIYWRRLFGVVAAASLIGTLAVGGYEFSTAYKNLQHAEVVLPTGNAASTESGKIAMEMPVSEPENEPATSGNISVRANTHAARNSQADNGTNNNVSDNNTVNNATDNNPTNNHTSTYSNDNNSNNNINSFNNKAEEGNVHAGRIVKPATAINAKTLATNTTNNDAKAHSNYTTENGNAVAAVNSNVVPDKPVGDDNRVKNGAKGNTTTHKTHATNEIAAKTTSTSTRHARKANKNTATASLSNVTNGSQTGNALATNTATENAVAKNEHGATIPTNAANKQDIGALNSSGPSVAITTPNTQTAGAKELVNISDGAKTTTTIATTKTKGGANQHSGNVRTTAIRKNAFGNKKTSVAATKNNGVTRRTTTSTAKVADGAVSTQSTYAASANGASKGVAANSKKATNSNNEQLSGNVSAKRIHKGGEKAVAGSIAPARSNTATSNAGGSEVDETEVEETVATTSTAKHGTTASGKANNIANKTTATGNGSKEGNTAQHRTASNHGTGNTKAATNGKPSASKQTTSALALNNGGTGDNGKQEDKKTITKMVVREREVKNSDNEVMTAVDTLSMETMNRGLAAKENENEEPGAMPNEPASKNATAANMSEPTTNDNKPESGNVTAKRKRHHSNSISANLAEEDAFAAAEAAGTPSAAAPASEEVTSASAPVAAETKTKTKSKHSGASLMNRMSAMFNDVKNQARGARPVAGITAGVNSNFFGPSKMMGFQFGMTGSMEFSEQWSLMAELKYFHRVNSNTINDDYYTYTQVGSQYQKQLVQTSYDFAAMHNIEMPMTIRYSKGNFNFFTGPNLLYTFSINTARATLPEMQAPTTVATMGNDNAPKYNDADFGSRFGLGYIFGFSYQVAPNAALDLRNVQTVWDNASTAGAKSVSSMLYRTPSVQLSIMYRLGGKKNEE